MKKIILVLIALVLLFSSCSQFNEKKVIEKDKIGILSFDKGLTLLYEGDEYNPAINDVRIMNRYKKLKYESSTRKDDTTRIDMSCDIEIDLTRLMDSTYVVKNIKNIKIQTYHLNETLNSLFDKY